MFSDKNIFFYPYNVEFIAGTNRQVGRETMDIS